VCLEEPAFYSLLDEVIDYVKQQDVSPDEWIDTDEAMRLLKISSKTTLQVYRDNPNNPIQFSQLSRKVILYSRSSIEMFLEQKTQHL